jgi:hypothetical protein
MANEKTEPAEKRLIQKQEPRKPYTKPAFRFERIFVTTALTCGKSDPTEFLCGQIRKVS